MSSLVMGIRSSRWPRLGLIFVMLFALLPLGVSAGSREGDGVTALTGSVEILPEQLAAFSEPMAMLVDVNSVFTGEVPAMPSQITAGLTQDGDTLSFDMRLPIRPSGTALNVTGPDTDEMPLVFSIDVVNNSTGTPYLEASDGLTGLPSLFTSVDPSEDDLDGQMAVWSDGNGAEFPIDAGDDGETLTGDDPTAELEAGWTIIDFTESPYTWSRDAEQEIVFSDLVSDIDFTGMGWAEAFAALIDQLEAEYAFTDIKEIDFDALRETYLPLVEAAEDDDDLDAYNVALYRFGLEFGDGHVSASRPKPWFTENYGGSYGLTLGQTDEGTVIVIDVVKGWAADEAGIERGDVVTGWQGDDIQDYLGQMLLPRAVSSDSERAGKLVRWITRGPLDSTVDIEWTDADGKEQSASLDATDDPDGLLDTIRPIGRSDIGVMPLESRVLDSGVGYIRINTFYTDQTLFTHQWDYALRTFREMEVTDLVIDVRANGGGWTSLPFYLATSFVDDGFILDEAYFADGDGGYDYGYDQAVPAGTGTWDGSVAVIVDGDCASSCEMFSAIMAGADDDDISIVGHTPSAGVYATIEVWQMPGDLTFQASYVRYQGQNEDEVFVEGEGVQLDLDVPVTEESLLSPEDEVLDAAEARVLGKDETTSGATSPAV